MDVIELAGGDGLGIALSEIGATWLSCRVPVAGKNREVLVSGEAPSAHYMGATVGRFANRIAGGHFSLGGRQIQLATNQGGHTLHGGPIGFDRKRWAVSACTDSSALFELESPDGDQGFPGRLVATVKYTVTAQNAVRITFRATTDAPTPVNLSNHAYFNLLDAIHGTGGLEHRLQIHADQYLPVADDGLPEGKLVDVSATPFDFRGLRVIGSPAPGAGYDHPFVLNDREAALTRPAAVLHAPDESLIMQVFTTKPALQLYTGQWLAGASNPSAGRYPPFAGIALESQFLPDSPNHPQWIPSCILKPGETYRHTTEFRFVAGSGFSPPDQNIRQRRGIFRE